MSGCTLLLQELKKDEELIGYPCKGVKRDEIVHQGYCPAGAAVGSDGNYARGESVKKIPHAKILT